MNFDQSSITPYHFSVNLSNVSFVIQWPSCQAWIMFSPTLWSCLTIFLFFTQKTHRYSIDAFMATCFNTCIYVRTRHKSRLNMWIQLHTCTAWHTYYLNKDMFQRLIQLHSMALVNTKDQLPTCKEHFSTPYWFPRPGPRTLHQGSLLG